MWTAGIAWTGIADYRGFYNTMEKSRDRITNQLRNGCLERLDALSPMANTDAVGIPLLVIQGEEDWITFQIRDFVGDARTGGADIAYEEIATLGRWTQDLDLKVQVWSRIEDFLRESI